MGDVERPWGFKITSNEAGDSSPNDEGDGDNDCLQDVPVNR